MLGAKGAPGGTGRRAQPGRAGQLRSRVSLRFLMRGDPLSRCHRLGESRGRERYLTRRLAVRRGRGRRSARISRAGGSGTPERSRCPCRGRVRAPSGRALRGNRRRRVPDGHVARQKPVARQSDDAVLPPRATAGVERFRRRAARGVIQISASLGGSGSEAGRLGQTQTAGESACTLRS